MGTTRDTITSPPPSVIPPNPHRQAPTVHGINSRIVFLTLSDVLCVRCQYIGIRSRNLLLNRSGLILQKKIRKFAQNRQTENSKTEATLILCGSKFVRRDEAIQYDHC